MKSILFGMFCFAVWSIIAVGSLFLGGCGGEGTSANQAPVYDSESLPLCDNNARCPCDAPRVPCKTKIPGQILVCYEGLFISIDDVGTFKNPECHPEVTTDAGMNPEASPEEDSAVESNAEAETDAEAEAEVDSGAESGNDDEPVASQATLEAILGNSVVNGFTVKKDTDYSAVDLAISASGNGVDVNKLVLGCTAAINGATYAPGDCWKRVTSVSLWDGSTQISQAQAPDMQGVMVFNNLTYHISHGETRHLVAKVSLSSSASNSLPHDRIAFGLYTDGITAQDSNLNAVVSTVSTVLASEQFSSQPAVSHEILPNGELNVEYIDDLSPGIMTGADSALWTRMAKHRATAQYEGARIDRVNVFMPAAENGMRNTNGDCSQIAVGRMDEILGNAVLPVGSGGNVDIDLSQNPITIPKDGSTDIVLWCLPAKPLPSAIAGFYSPRTGDRPALGLMSSLQTNEWNASYIGKANMRTTGQTSGERLYAPAVAEHGPFMVLRGNSMFITKQNTNSNVLQVGQIQAYKFSVMASPYGGAMSVAQYAFDFDATPGVKYRPMLYQGGSLADTWSYSYTQNGNMEPCNNDYGTNCYLGHHQILFRFNTEQVIQPGNSLEFTVVMVVDALPVGSTYLVANFVKQGVHDTGPAINLACWDSPDPTLGFDIDYQQYSRPGIIASDMTEIPHMLAGNCGQEPIGSSNDFFGDFLLLDHLTANTLSN